jgi:hypothetical protein
LAGDWRVLRLRRERKYFAPAFEVLTQPESQYSTPPMLMVPL